MFEWISGARNKAADCLSQLVELPEKHQKNPSGTKPTLINMVKTVTTRSGMRKTPTDKKTKKLQPMEQILDSDTTSNICQNNPKDTSIKEMQSTNPFCPMHCEKITQQNSMK